MHVLQPYLRVAVATEEDFEKAKAEGYSEIFRITAEGVFKYHKIASDHSRYISIKVSAIPGLELAKAPKEETSFLPAGKVPRHLFDEIVALYRQVMSRNNGRNLEAMAWIIWNKDAGYHIHVPQQKVSGASVEYEWDVPSGNIVIVDTHSHNSMGAFFSGTDDGDDRRGIRFSGVVGKLTNTSYDTVWRFCYQGKFLKAEFTDIFGPPANIDVPEEWLDNIKIQTYAGYSGYQGGYQGAAGNGYGHNGAGGRARGRADHLKEHQFKPGHQNGKSTPERPTTREILSYEDEYAEYYANQYPDAGGVNGFPRSNPNTGTRQIPDQRSNPSATTLDPNAPIRRPNTPAIHEGLSKITPMGEGKQGNVEAGPSTGTIVAGGPAKEDKDVVVAKNAMEASTTKTEPSKTAPIQIYPRRVEIPGEQRGISEDSLPDGHPLKTWDEQNLQFLLEGVTGIDDDSTLNMGPGFLNDASGEEYLDGTTSIENHPRYSEIATNHGVSAAMAFCMINEFSESLTDCPELLDELVTDFFQFLPQGDALRTFRSLYQLLTATEQEDINQKGI
jgi:PRTRC genetic system protein A